MPLRLVAPRNSYDLGLPAGAGPNFEPVDHCLTASFAGLTEYRQN
jgi:hypothetical protein